MPTLWILCGPWGLLSALGRAWGGSGSSKAGSWALRGGLGTKTELSKNDDEMKVAHTAGKNAILARLSFSPKRSRPYVYGGFSDFLKNTIFLTWALLDFQGGPGRVLRGAFGAPGAS